MRRVLLVLTGALMVALVLRTLVVRYRIVAASNARDRQELERQQKLVEQSIRALEEREPPDGSVKDRPLGDFPPWYGRPLLPNGSMPRPTPTEPDMVRPAPRVR